MRNEFITAKKIVLEKGALRNLDSDLKELDLKNVLVLSSNSLVKYGNLESLLNYFNENGIKFTLIDKVMPEPTAEHIQSIRDKLSDSYDLVMGIGGGSVLDTTKIISVLLTNDVSVEEVIGKNLVKKDGVKTILVPSTAGTGAEVTPNAIVTLPEKNLKEGVITPKLYPDIVILDSELLTNLPKNVIAATGMDSFTHGIESYISNKSNRLSEVFSRECIRLISKNIKNFYNDSEDYESGEEMLVASMYGGMALSSAGTAAVHALAYPLGGTYGVAHGVANSMLLPHVMRFNFDYIQNDLVEIGKIMGLEGEETQLANIVIEQIERWTSELDIPQDLKEFGISEDDIEELAHSASQVTRLLDNNPKKLTLEDIKSIYRNLI